MAKIVQVFNRYVYKGGEEASVERIYKHASDRNRICRCFFESSDWLGRSAPPKLAQLGRTFYNHQSKAQLNKVCDYFGPDALLFHNVFPMGSPSIFHLAKQKKLPIIQYVHNFRPFSVGGTLYANGQIMEHSLKGNYLPEAKAGAWQGSALKSLILAGVLTYLRRSGLLNQVEAWVCISEFIKQKFMEAGIPEDRLFALRHSWDRLCLDPTPWETLDQNYYLFLGRLVDVKGIEHLLNTWARLYQKYGEKTPHLCICGEGPLENMVREATHINPAVRFRGMVTGDEKARLIHSCKAMVVPSIWYEPLGLVVYEAYDFGRPVIASASGGMTETIHHEKTGWLYPLHDTEGLFRSVEEFEKLTLDDRVQLGRAGNQWLGTNTSVDDWKTKFQVIVDRVTLGN